MEVNLRAFTLEAGEWILTRNIRILHYEAALVNDRTLPSEYGAKVHQALKGATEWNTLHRTGRV
jgi:hypothetical protein